MLSRFRCVQIFPKLVRMCPSKDSVVFRSCRLVVSSSIWPITELCSRQILSTLAGVGKRGAYLLVHGDLPRQHPFGTTLSSAGPVPADSRQ